MQPHRKECWVIPPKASGDFVACMEDVLSIYQLSYDPDYPVICMDESNKQLTKEVRKPLPPVPGHPARYDSLYERNGVADVFLFVEPLRGFRVTSVTSQRRAVDWARQVKTVLDMHYPSAKKVRLVMDQLNTHRASSFYEAFAPEEARRLIERLEIHHTPKHGSWLNIAEIELAALSRQCLNRRIPDMKTMAKEVAAWTKERNKRLVKVDWQFTTEKARVKLKSLYPKFSLG